MNKKLALIALVPFALQAAPADHLADLLYGNYGKTIEFGQKFVARPAARGVAHAAVDHAIDKKVPSKEIVNKAGVNLSTNDLVKFLAHVGLHVGDDFLAESVSRDESGHKNGRSLKDIARANAVQHAAVALFTALCKVPEEKLVAFLGFDDFSLEEALHCPHATAVAKGVVAETKHQTYAWILAKLIAAIPARG